MSQTVHIAWKDVRSLRWILLLGLAGLGARVLLVANATVAAEESVAAGTVLQQAWNTTALIGFLLMALIVARLVLEEPLVGFTPFWLTRPYDKGSLLREKLLFAAIALIGLPAIADVVTMSMFNAGPRALVTTGMNSVLANASWAFSLIVIATVSPSLGAFALTALGVAAVVTMLPATLLGFSTLWRPDVPGYAPPSAPDATGGVVMIAVYLCAALSVVVYQYRQRRWRVAAGLAAAGLVATVVVPLLWPWPFARGQLVRAGAWASNVTLVHDASWGTKVIDVRNVSRPLREAWRQVNARVVVTGVPPQIRVQRMGIRSRLLFSDGTTLESSQVGGFASFSLAEAETALRARVIATRESTARETWTPMITLTEQEFLRRRGQPARLEADIDLIAMQMREVARLPLTPGAGYEQGMSRLEITGVRRGADSRDLVIRRSTTRSLLSTEPTPERFFALRRRGGGEALMGGTEASWQLGGPLYAPTLLLRPFAAIAGSRAFSLLYFNEGFSVGSMQLRFPGRGFGIVPDLDLARFDDAELVVLESTFAGIATRHLVIDNFRLETK
jgi:hypothetical protein